MNLPDWKEVLPIPPTGGHLHEAWMTTFEPPDAGLLVEHILPSLLRTSRLLSEDVQERTLFFGELGTALEALHGRITVISSPPRGERETSHYPWLWRYLGHFTVGADSRAVQHAKLWAFHWKVDKKEYLELHVSSTNLTASAFKGQVQAGWQVILPLISRSTASARNSWGELVPFLNALGNSAGSIASSRVQRLVALLGRVECPADVTFIASVPGNKSAARLLKQFAPTEIHVLAPTIGEWNKGTLMYWSKDVGIDTSKVYLKWINDGHSWANPNWWSISKPALELLKDQKVRLNCLPPSPRFINEHQDSDERWSHAKLYLLRSRKKRHLLVTSANWSASAWGAGNTTPRNFELGVVFETKWLDLERFDQSFSANTAPYCSFTERRIPEDSKLQWAEATWDGKRIELHARSADASTSIEATIGFTGGSEQQITLIGGAATTQWNDAERTPVTVRFIQADDALEADVIDLRLAAEFSKTPLPEVDPALSATLREAFLLQRYGGPAVDVDSISGLGPARRPCATAPTADYSVQAWVEARAAFNVVDRWRTALEEARESEPMLLDRICLDGQELRKLYARREGPAAALVTQELCWRLQGTPDG